MAYVVDYKYYQEKSKGEYNRDESLSGTVKIGSPYEEIALEVLAGKVMALMARRNILVFDLEIYEIAKKPISFKETNDGIVIKNKKFKFDDGSTVTGIEETSDETITMLKKIVDEQPNLLALLNNSTQPQQEKTTTLSAPVQSNITPKRPLRYEVFDPDPWIVELNHGNVKSMKFTKGKKYPIYQERMGDSSLGVLYTTVDDSMKERVVLDKYFISGTQLIQQGSEQREGLVDTGLNWGGVINDSMPKLRG